MVDVGKVLAGAAVMTFPIWDIVPGDEGLLALTLPVGLGMIADGVGSETAQEAVN